MKQLVKIQKHGYNPCRKELGMTSQEKHIIQTILVEVGLEPLYAETIDQD